MCYILLYTIHGAPSGHPGRRLIRHTHVTDKKGQDPHWFSSSHSWKQLFGYLAPLCNGALGAALARLDRPSKDVIDDHHCPRSCWEVTLEGGVVIHPYQVPFIAEVSHHLPEAHASGQARKVVLLSIHVWVHRLHMHITFLTDIPA